MAAPAFQIGADVWPGLLKLAEECGELVQVLGKLMAYPGGQHPDGGAPLEVRLTQETADVMAAIAFVYTVNPGIDEAHMKQRAEEKIERFCAWHEESQR
jgi:NTP pyrophosphatase (non-canonical NTP hydrolase)